ncbi:helix-turn-helix domain-containing protein [Streptomyces sp. NPDC004726]
MAPEGNTAPDPEEARNAAEFVARLQALKDWSGLTYRELTSRADAVGEVLPRSTVANMLSRSTVPREELVAAFVRACGCGPGSMETWLRVRKELSRRERQSVEVPEYQDVESPVPTEDGTSHGPARPPSSTEPPPTSRRIPLTAWIAAAVALSVIAVAVVVGLALRDDDSGSASGPPSVSGPASASGPASGSGATPSPKTKGTARSAAPPAREPVAVPLTTPSPGPVRIKAVHSGLCLAERGEQSGALYQMPCATGSIPDFSLTRLPEGWRIATQHPVFGPGCSGVMEKSAEAGAPVHDQECGLRGSAEVFTIESVGAPAGEFRLRPVHSGLCVGVEGAVEEPAAAIRQLACTKGGEGQRFALERVPAPAGS